MLNTAIWWIGVLAISFFLLTHPAIVTGTISILAGIVVAVLGVFVSAAS